MMKNIYISISVFIVMLIAMFFSISYLNKVCRELEAANKKVQNYIEAEDWNKAYSASENFKKKWDKYSNNISIFVNHQEIDNIEIETAKLPQFIKEKTKDEALATVKVIDFLIDHVKKLESITLQNIF